MYHYKCAIILYRNLDYVSLNLSVFFFLNTIFVSSHMYPENPEGTQVIVGSVNMGYISNTARNRAHNLFCPKREPIPLGHGNGGYHTSSHRRVLRQWSSFVYNYNNFYLVQFKFNK